MLEKLSPFDCVRLITNNGSSSLCLAEAWAFLEDFIANESLFIKYNYESNGLSIY